MVVAFRFCNFVSSKLHFSLINYKIIQDSDQSRSIVEFLSCKLVSLLNNDKNHEQ